MKKKSVMTICLVAALSLTAFKVADNIITRLGMQQESAQYAILSNIIGRFESGPMNTMVEDGPTNNIYNQLKSFRIPYARMLPQVISGDKAAAAKELCVYIKEYLSSEKFMTDYQKAMDEANPLTDNGTSFATLKRNSEVHRINIKNYPNDTKYIAEQQKLLDESEKRISKMMEAAKKPFPGKDAWLKTFPSDPAILIKQRLQEYLQVVATVDFSAKLTGTGKKQTFVNPVYEKKSLKWKAIYRAGKEVNDVVTTFVKEWLKEGIQISQSVNSKQ